MRITQKLGVLVAVPLCAVSGFGAIALVSSGSGALQADRLWSLMNTANAAGRLTSALQDERTLVALYLTASQTPSTLDQLDAQIAKSELAASAYHDLVSRLPAQSAQTDDLLRRVEVDLAQIKELRDQIRMRQAPALSAIVFQYRIVIADLAQFRESVAQADGASATVTQDLHAADALYQASEYTGQEEASALRGAISSPLSAAAQSDIGAAQRGYSQALESYDAIAGPEWVDRPDEALTGGIIGNADRYEDVVARTPVNSTAPVSPQEWVSSLDARRYALDQVQLDLDTSILDAIAQTRDHQQLVAEIEGASVAATILIAVVVSLRLGRPMIRGLRDLRDGAHAVAYEYLPRAVDSMRAQGSLTGRTPEEFAENFGEAVRVTGDDELTAVARAFNAVHTEAIRTAAEQVLLRAGVGATFVALARRGERLTGALTAELDRAEANEQDPDRLARLFVLDHLAARMSRNNESLLVLGGEGTVRIRDNAVPLTDVARAAMGRIERYTRVDLTQVDPQVEIVAGAIDHLVHLIAELLDNATAFSSPNTRVAVEAHRLADRVVLRIVDAGIGMTQSQRADLNARLASPRQVDISTVRAMGLTVVAHLASWYNINVELRPRPEGGTVAEISLPRALYGGALPALSAGTPMLGTGVSPLQDVAPPTGTGWAAESEPADAAAARSESDLVSASAGSGEEAGQGPAMDRGGWSPARAAVPPSPLGPVWPTSPGHDATPTPWQDDSDLFGPAWPQGAGTGRRRGGVSPAEAGAASAAPGTDSSIWPPMPTSPTEADLARPAAHAAGGTLVPSAGIARRPEQPAVDARPGYPEADDPSVPRHAASAMTPVPPPGLSAAELDAGAKPSPWLTGPRQRSGSAHSSMPMTMSGAGAYDVHGEDYGTGGHRPGDYRSDEYRPGDPSSDEYRSGGRWPGDTRPGDLWPGDAAYADRDAYRRPDTDPVGPPAPTVSPEAVAAYAAYAPPPTFGPPAASPYEPAQSAAAPAAPFRPETMPTHDDATSPFPQHPDPLRTAVYPPEPAPEPVRAYTPPAAPAAPPEPAPPRTTMHGLPIRVPQTSLPAEAREARANGPAAPATPSERDPRRVSATMAAYARGLNARPGQPGAGGQQPPQYRATGHYGVPTTDDRDDNEQHPYPPTPNTGNY